MYLCINTSGLRQSDHFGLIGAKEQIPPQDEVFPDAAKQERHTRLFHINAAYMSRVFKRSLTRKRARRKAPVFMRSAKGLVECDMGGEG
jgi:hypothetical protein